MAGTITGFAQGQLNTWFNGAVLSPALPSAFFAALDTGNVGAGGLQFEVSSGNSYARLSLTRNTTNWPTISSGNTITNSTTAFSFAAATGPWTGNSGANTTIKGVELLDSGTIGAGNGFFYGTLTSAVSVNNGQVLTFATSNFSIQLA